MYSNRMSYLKGRKEKNQSGGRSRWIRPVIQAGFFLFVFLIVLTHFLTDHGVTLPWKAPSLHAICPFGAVESAGRLVIQDKFIPKTHESNIWILLAATGATFLMGAVFCGWICPLGSVQDWIGRLGKKFFPKIYNRLPRRLDHMLGYLRYIVLALVVIRTTQMINLVFASIDPYYALFHFWTGEALPSAVIVLLFVLVSSLFVARPWCRWLCPFGAVQGIIQFLSPWKIRRNSPLCKDCAICSRACPMRIDVHRKKYVSDTRCNRCGECLAACPVSGALDHSLPGRIPFSLRNRFLSAAVILILFAAPLIVAESAGLFKTSNRVEITAGGMQAADIKGSHSLNDLATGFNSDLASLLDYLGLPPSIPGETKLMDLEDLKDLKDLDKSVTTRIIRENMSSFP